MGRFNKTGHRSVPTLNTSSLPDLIFTLLFFFMIVTNMRDTRSKVEFTLPQATRLEKLERKALPTTLYVGRPAEGYRDRLGDRPLIQLNDVCVSIEELTDYLLYERASLAPEDLEHWSISLKIDQDTKMGTVIDIKEALRKANALNVNYVAHEKE